MEEFITKIKMEFEEKEREVEELKKRIDMLQNAMIILMAGKQEPIRVSRKDFVEIHDRCVGLMDDDEAIQNLLYCNGNKKANVTVQWNNLYCDCQDGAIVSNYVFPAIDEMESELEGDETV